MSATAKTKGMAMRYIGAVVAFAMLQVLVGFVAEAQNFSVAGIAMAAVIEIVGIASIIFFVMDGW